MNRGDLYYMLHLWSVFHFPFISGQLSFITVFAYNTGSYSPDSS